MCALSMLLLVSAAANLAKEGSNVTFVPPAGWRLPLRTESMPEGSSSWRASRHDHALRAGADFDGDGSLDHASLLVREGDHHLGLFAMLGDDRHWLHLDAAERSMISVLEDPALVSVGGVPLSS